MGKLADALRRKFKNPQDALKALGMDSADLAGLIVGDSKENLMIKQKPKGKIKSRQAAIGIGVLSSYLRPLIAKDSKLDLRPIFASVNAKNYSAKKPAILAALKKTVKLKPKVAM